jgi:hypothetical protein
MVSVIVSVTINLTVSLTVTLTVTDVVAVRELYGNGHAHGAITSFHDILVTITLMSHLQDNNVIFTESGRFLRSIQNLKTDLKLLDSLVFP